MDGLDPGLGTLSLARCLPREEEEEEEGRWMRWPGGVAPFDLAQVTTSPTTCITLRNGSVLASSSDLLRSTRAPAAASAASASGRCSAERRAMDWIASVIEYVHGPCELSTYRTTTLVMSTCAHAISHTG